MPGIGRLVNKGMMYLKTRGIRETSRRAVLHVQRKQSEKRYVRKMTPSQSELGAQREESRNWSIRFSVVVPLYNTPLRLLEEMISSVRNQSYQSWELCMADGSDEAHGEVGEFCRKLADEDSRIRYQKLDKNMGISGNSNAALEMAEGDYIALLDHDDLLMPNALFEMARTIRESGADFLYSDEMIFTSPKVTNIVGIRFKQDFSSEDLLTNNYICHLTVFRRVLLEKSGPFRPEYDGSQDHDLILRLTDAAEKVTHVPKVLYLWRSVAGSTASDIHTKEYAIDSGRRAVETFMHAHGRTQARAESSEVFPTMYRIREPIEGEPSVRILLSLRKDSQSIPKNGKTETEIDGLCRLQQKTVWKPCAWQIVEYRTGTGKNRNQTLSEAVLEAKENYLVFLDGIPEDVSPDWVEEMLMLARRREIGAVGARVRFTGGKDIRHAGVILGLGKNGTAGRPYYDRYDDGVGFFGQLAVAREVSAVTDCWMIRRDLLEEAGGFRKEYQDCLFDLDLCLRLRENGYHHLWTPHAIVQGGRAKDFALDVGAECGLYSEDSKAFLASWGTKIEQGDPFYNPNLSLKHEDWRIEKNNL